MLSRHAHSEVLFSKALRQSICNCCESTRHTVATCRLRLSFCRSKHGTTMAPRPTPRKAKQPEASPTSIFDMLTLDSPVSSVATTPGAVPFSPLRTPNGSHNGNQSSEHLDQLQGCTVRRSPRQAATRKRAGGLPPQSRASGAAPQPPSAAPTACVSHPWWHFRSATPGAAPAAAAPLMGSQPSGELPPLPRPPSFTRQDSGLGRSQNARALAAAAQLHDLASDPAAICGTGADCMAADLPENCRKSLSSRCLNYSSDACAANTLSDKAAAQQAGGSMPLPTLRIDRTDSNASSSSFSLWRSSSGVNTTDMQQVRQRANSFGDCAAQLARCRLQHGRKQCVTNAETV